MQHTELLHRFFDEGLDESLEDVLFERMAVDPDLRGEFLQHLKLHSMIQEDVATITTPSHVSQQLFVDLGLTPPEHVPAGGLRQKIGALAVGLRTQIAKKRRYIYTALGSAAVTALLIFGISETITETGAVKQDPRMPGTESVRDAAETVNPLSGSEPAAVDGRGQAPAIANPQASPRSAIADAGSSSLRAGTGQKESVEDGGSLGQKYADATSAPAVSTASERSSATESTDNTASAISAAEMHVSPPGQTDYAAVLSLPDPRGAAAFTGEQVTGANPMERLMDLADIEPVMKEPGDGSGEWHFFRPGPRANILSNLVFELRKYYGQSFPEVDQPHSSHNVFEDMALSAVYKVTEHHAFGFEYGREGFGRSYQDYDPAATRYTDASVQELFDPPETMMMREVRENRMLDLFGAVWKLSLPEYGMFGVVYPYMRSFVGATRLGPLGKVRIGLEMFPSNFSMLNVGIEGGLLRYSVEDMAYYTSKLNFTFGVAIGF